MLDKFDASKLTVGANYIDISVLHPDSIKVATLKNHTDYSFFSFNFTKQWLN